MAKRINLTHDEETRRKIRVSQLINRLEENTFSPKELMTAGQVQSARILLSKCLPDLQTLSLGTGTGKAKVIVEWDNG